MDLSPKGAHFIVRREAIVLAPYRDGFLDEAKTQPRWSVGMGALAKKGGRTKPITVKKAFHLLHKEVASRIQVVSWAVGFRRWSSAPTLLLPHQFDAVFSLYYQGGSDGLKAVAAHVMSGRLDQAAEEFLNWPTDRDGVEKDGLKARRELERVLFLTGDYGILNPVRLYRQDPHDNPNYDQYVVTDADLRGWTEPDEDGDE